MCAGRGAIDAVSCLANADRIYAWEAESGAVLCHAQDAAVPLPAEYKRIMIDADRLVVDMPSRMYLEMDEEGQLVFVNNMLPDSVRNFVWRMSERVGKHP